MRKAIQTHATIAFVAQHHHLVDQPASVTTRVGKVAGGLVGIQNVSDERHERGMIVDNEVGMIG